MTNMTRRRRSDAARLTGAARTDSALGAAARARGRGAPAVRAPGVAREAESILWGECVRVCAVTLLDVCARRKEE